MSIELYPHQKKAMVGIFDLLKKRKRALIEGPTGSGKTEIFLEVCDKFVQRKKKVLIVVKMRSIVGQTFARAFDRFGLTDVTLIMGREHYVEKSLVHVASVDTLTSWMKGNRVFDFSQYDLIICDEAHNTTSDQYRKLFWTIEGNELKDYSPERLKKLDFKKYYVGFTATPYKVGKKVHDFWTGYACVSKTSDLIESGFLSPYEYYAPTKLDLSGLQVSKMKDDYLEKELFEVMDHGKIYADIVKYYKKISPTQPALCFCIDINHSKFMVRKFREAGIEADHCDAETNSKKRHLLLSRLDEKIDSNEPYVLCNVNIFSTGVDIPKLRTGIMARPTKSLILYKQQIGRMLRRCKGKDKAIIIDHANNVTEHGFPCEYHKPHMTELNVKEYEVLKAEGPIKHKICPSCSHVNKKEALVCDLCNSFFPEVDEKSEERDTEDAHMVRIKAVQSRNAAALRRFLAKSDRDKVIAFRAYIEKIVEPNIKNGMSAKDAWLSCYSFFGKWFFKYATRAGCPEIHYETVRKQRLLDDLKDGNYPRPKNPFNYR